MRKYLKFVLLISLILFFTCFAPPENTKEINLFIWIQKMIDKLNLAVKNREKQRVLLEEIWDNNEYFAYYKHSSINITSFESKKSDLLYSINNNSFIIKQPLYITYLNNDMYVSKDGVNWLIFKLNDNSLRGNEEYFEADYEVKHSLDKEEKNLNISYSISFVQKKEFKTIKLKEKKDIITLSKDMILADKDKNNLTIDLSKFILYIPPETILSGKLKIDGNVVISNSNNGTISIKSLVDIFIYAKNKMLAISFDRKNWGVSILSFNISPNLTVKSLSDKHIEFFLYIKAIYKM